MTELEYTNFFQEWIISRSKNINNRWINYSKLFNSYTLKINYNDSRITVKYLEDIKANVYAYVNSLYGEKYGYDPITKGYKYLAKSSPFDFLDSEHPFYELSFRIVRILLPNGKG